MVTPSYPKIAEACRTSEDFKEVLRVELVGCTVWDVFDDDFVEEGVERRISRKHELAERPEPCRFALEINASGEYLPEGLLL